MTDALTETERPLRADARRNRERILESARDVFGEYGVDAQMDDVASRAGVGVGTVYRHFPTKEALMVELVRQKFRLFAAGAREALERDGEPFAVFADLMRGNADALARDAGMQHVLVGVGQHIWAQAQTEKDELNTLTAELIGSRPARRDDAPRRQRERHRDADVRPVRHDDPEPPRLRLAPAPRARDRHAPGTVSTALSDRERGMRRARGLRKSGVRAVKPLGPSSRSRRTFVR